MTTQHCIVRPYRQAVAGLSGLCSDSEGWARLTDSTRGPVQTQRDSISVLNTDEVVRLTLWTPKAVALLEIGELVLVIGVFFDS